MRTKTKELKRIARGNLQGQFLTFIRVYIFCTLIVSLLEVPFSMMTNEVPFSTPNIIYYVAILLISIASVVLTAGQYRLHLGLARTGELHISDLFIPLRFHSNQFILTELILLVIYMLVFSPVFCASYFAYTNDSLDNYILLLGAFAISLVLSAYVSLNFRLVYFVMIDDENISMIQALKYTQQIVKSHKGRYFYMQLSFFGMLFLCVLSFGIGFLWVRPYIIHSTALFYLDVKGELPEIIENKKKTESTPEPVLFNEYV